MSLPPTSASFFRCRFSPVPHLALSVAAAALIMGTPVPSKLTTSSAPSVASWGTGRWAEKSSVSTGASLATSISTRSATSRAKSCSNHPELSLKGGSTATKVIHSGRKDE